MAIANAQCPEGDLDIWYETFGYADDPPLLLIMGLGAQAIAWPDEFCQGFVDRGFFVIRYDNRDVGLSSKLPGEVDIVAAAAALAENRALTAGYHLADMANDAVAVLDALGLAKTHVLGASMGGMIAQQLAIDHSDRVESLTSLMSTTGQRDVGQPEPELLGALLAPPASSRDEAIASGLAWLQLAGSPDHGDEDLAAELAGRQFDRGFFPSGVARQLLAIVASPERSAGLAALAVPTLVLHGTADRLIPQSGGERTAELVPGATLELIEGMGHDLPVYFWSRIIELVTRHAANAASPY